MLKLYHKVSSECSRLVTKNYSTSFSIGIFLLDKSIRMDVYALYGFVRFGDEIVDTFHDYPKKHLLQKYYDDTFEAIKLKISLNPILHSFQQVVNKFKIEHWQIKAFLDSMFLDLHELEYDQKGIENYILGSAQAVGLMCLKVFCHGDEKQYKSLEKGALALGAAFQKINFIRDIKIDRVVMGRNYFPTLKDGKFDNKGKKIIENQIDIHLEEAFKNILHLPKNCRFAVYIAYTYYTHVFKKIKKTEAKVLLEKRLRISNFTKISLLILAKIKFIFKIIK